MSRTAEDDVLLYCLGADAHRAGAVGSGLPARADWNGVIERAIPHGVAPLLHKRIAAGGAGAAIPLAARRRLRAIYLRSGARNLRVFHDLAAVLAGLRGDGVEVIALKGAHLAPIVYGDIAVRPMGDVDLLVPKGDLSRAEATLRRVGCRLERPGGHNRHWYASRHFHLRYRARGGTPVELHWDLAPPSARSRMSIGGIWQRAQPAQIAGVDVLAMSPEDLILHLCLHASQAHEYEWGLKPLCDVAAVVSHFAGRIDWEALLRHVADCRIDRAACWVLRLAREMLAADVPRRVLGRLGLDALEPQFVETLQEYTLSAAFAPGQGDDEGPWEVLGSLDRARGLRRRASVLLRAVLPPVDRLRDIYALPPGTLRAYVYYLLRPFDLLRRRGADMLRWALGTRSAERAIARETARDAVLRAMADERSPGPDQPPSREGSAAQP